MFDLILKFTSLIDLQDFLKSYQKSQNKKNKIHSINDENTTPSARGQAVRELHQKAKIYKIDHPEIDYKQCLKMINK